MNKTVSIIIILALILVDLLVLIMCIKIILKLERKKRVMVTRRILYLQTIILILVFFGFYKYNPIKNLIYGWIPTKIIFYAGCFLLAIFIASVIDAIVILGKNLGNIKGISLEESKSENNEIINSLKNISSKILAMEDIYEYLDFDLDYIEEKEKTIRNNEYDFVIDLYNVLKAYFKKQKQNIEFNICTNEQEVLEYLNIKGLSKIYLVSILEKKESIIENDIRDEKYAIIPIGIIEEDKGEKEEFRYITLKSNDDILVEELTIVWTIIKYLSEIEIRMTRELLND